MGAGGSKAKSKSDSVIKAPIPKDKRGSMDAGVGSNNLSGFPPQHPQDLEVKDFAENSPKKDKKFEITMQTRTHEKIKGTTMVTNNTTASNRKGAGFVSGFNQNRDIDDIEEMVMDTPIAKKKLIHGEKPEPEIQVSKQKPFFNKPPETQTASQPFFLKSPMGNH